jgi:hypothetical protein
MCPPLIPQMSKNEATESQRQSEAIRGNQRPSVACHTEANRDHQMQSGRTSDEIRRNQTQSDAIRRNQAQSDAISMPGTSCFRVFVFWAGRKGLCFVFLCFEPAQRACVLCFRVLADPPQNTGGRQISATACPVCPVCVPAPPGIFLPVTSGPAPQTHQTPREILTKF